MARASIDEAFTALAGRSLPGGGFAHLPGGAMRADATCWAIVALGAAGVRGDLVDAARTRVAEMQGPDGRVCISSQHHDALWPTAPAILAWHGAPQHQPASQRALQFLTDFQQVWVVEQDTPITGHNDTFRGWPWIGKTHPWVEPTAYALLAMRVAGQAQHARAADAVRLLLDRQMRSGGWNYGNTTIFGRELRPMPETTGVALQALAGLVDKTAVELSLVWLKGQMGQMHAPMSFAWSTLGLAAWDESMEDRQERIAEILGRQERYGPYDTASLSLLLLAATCEAGLVVRMEGMS